VGDLCTSHWKSLAEAILRGEYALPIRCIIQRGAENIGAVIHSVSVNGNRIRIYFSDNQRLFISPEDDPHFFKYGADRENKPVIFHPLE